MDELRFVEQLRDLGIELTEQQLQQFARYYDLLIEWNNKMNLTAITEKEEVYLKHFYDSISAQAIYDFGQEISIVDVGAGAGFPCLPLKICFPHLQVTIVDSLRKRTLFLEHLVEQLGLEQVQVYHDRAETFAQNTQQREQYDLVLARAVARLHVLSELCLPLVKVEGSFLAMKGSKGEEELEEAQKAILLLGGEVSKASSFQLPQEEGGRTLVLIKKIKKTPKKYPRKPGIPQKEPLV